MAGLVERAALLSLVGATLLGCVAPERPSLPTYDRAAYVSATPQVAPTPAFAWSNGNKYAIIVRKRERSLTLYERGKQIKVYPIVLGIAPVGPKTYKGDLRTPEGVYHISGKRVHERWSRFMLLSYPNRTDRDRYRSAVRLGTVPITNGSGPGPGGEIGIHGTDRAAANRRGVDWTLGCVSMFNDHVRDLYNRIPIGTPVLVRE